MFKRSEEIIDIYMYINVCRYFEIVDNDLLGLIFVSQFYI